MANFKNLVLTADEGILTILISRESKMNALNTEILDELRNAVQDFYDDKEAKGLIIAGAGDKAFASGADIEELAGFSELQGRKFSENGQEIFTLIENSHKPIIAAVDGYALGGGCELAMACHIRVATEKSFFGLPEATLGIIPGYGGTQRLTQLIGKGRALEMMMTADKIPARTALQIGLINHMTETREEMFAKSREILEKILGNGPLAVGMLVSCVNAVYNHDENGFQTESNSFSSCFKSEDFKEGIKAFLEKRKPVFKGK